MTACPAFEIMTGVEASGMLMGDQLQGSLHKADALPIQVLVVEASIIGGETFTGQLAVLKLPAASVAVSTTDCVPI